MKSKTTICKKALAIFMSLLMLLPCVTAAIPVAFAADAYISLNKTYPTISTVFGSFANDNNYLTNDNYAAIYKNLLWSETNVSTVKAQITGDLVTGDSGYKANRNIYYPTVVMLYDGVTDPTFGIMFGMVGTKKPGSWNYNNMRVFSVSLDGATPRDGTVIKHTENDDLEFADSFWHGHPDGSLNNQWNYLGNSETGTKTTYL